MKLRAATSWIVAAVVGTLAALPVEASSIKIFDGTSTLTVTDQDFVADPGAPADGAPPAGIVSYIGGLGVWTFTLTAGYSKPMLGSATVPEMHLDGSAFSSAPGTLTISFSDTDFGPTGTLVKAGVGGASSGTVTYETYKGVALFDTTDPLTTASFGAGPFSGTKVTGLTGEAGPYSLTQQITIQHQSGFVASSFNATLSVPDGGATLSLLGIGFLGVAALRRRLGNGA